MNTDEKKAYKIIYDGLRNRNYQIEVPFHMLSEQIQEIYIRVLYDNPMLFYVNQTTITMCGQPGAYSLIPEYLYTEREIAQLIREIQVIVDKIHTRVDTLQDEFRIERFLHDSVVKSVPYDYDALNKKDCFNAHSIIGAFIDKKAVCEGIAKAFKFLCNEFSMKCIVVYGKASQDGDFSGDTYHAWNLVKVRNESYYVDVTWDNMCDGEIRHISYDYFNVTTEEILKDHMPNIATLPVCRDTRLNYFYATNSIIDTYDQLVALIKTRISAKEIMFKTTPGQGAFADIEDFKRKTYEAVLQAMRESGTAMAFALMFNEMHGIGKVMLLPD